MPHVASVARARKAATASIAPRDSQAQRGSAGLFTSGGVPKRLANSCEAAAPRLKNTSWTSPVPLSVVASTETSRSGTNASGAPVRATTR